MKLSIIIVSYNVKHFLRQCLESIYASDIDHEETEIFVVDNASPDHTPQYIAHHFPKKSHPRLQIISNSRNVGFGRANNQALKRAKGEYVLFLNPDTLLHGQTLRRCMEYADRHPGIGGIGTKMLRDNGAFAFESRRSLPTPWVAFCKMFGLSTLFPQSRLFGKYYLRYLDETQATPIDVISGAFFMVRREALDRVGGFDEEFFMYGEDIDLSYRLQMAGFENYYLPYPILHYKGESTQKSSFRYVHVFYTAMLIFFKKHFRACWIGLSIPIKLAILFKALLSLLMGQIRRTREFLLPVKPYKSHKFIYVGRHAEQVRDMAEKWWLDVEYVEADQQSRPQTVLPTAQSPVNYTHVVYDAEDFSYSHMLETFENSDHRAYIGIYHPEENIIITASRIFQVGHNRSDEDEESGTDA